MIGGIHIDQVGIQTVLKGLDDALGLILAHQAMVDMHADQLLANGLDQQSGNHRRVDTAGQRQQNLLVANLLTHSSNLLFDERIGQLRSGDSLHVFGTNIAHQIVHIVFLHKLQKRGLLSP